MTKLKGNSKQGGHLKWLKTCHNKVAKKHGKLRSFIKEISGIFNTNTKKKLELRKKITCQVMKFKNIQKIMF